METNEKVCLITGATSGIGKETAIGMAKLGYQIVFTSRNSEKGKLVRDEIIQITGNQNISMIECDLESFQSIRHFTEVFKSKFNKLDVLINNAGIWETQRSESKEGIEKTFAINHLAPFLLTNLLLDLIIKSSPSRIVNVSSEAHRASQMNFGDIEGKKKWSSMSSYGQSKLANILFTKKLAEMLKETQVTVNCLHPGVVNTNLFDKFGPIMKSMFQIIMITPEKGAQTSIYLASSSEVSNISGEYFVRKKIKNSNIASKDMDSAEKLWKISAKYVGL